MKQTLILSFIVAFFSCTDYGSVDNIHRNDYENRCKIEFLGKKEVPADDNTSTRTSYIQYIDTEELPHTFAAVNRYTNSINLYDYDRCLLRKKICYDKEGANGTGDIQGFSYINPDSIFVFCYDTQIFYLTNEDAKVLWQKRMPAEGIRSAEFMPAIPLVQTNLPLAYMDRKLILQGSIFESLYETETNSPITSIYDFDHDTVVYANHYPEQYRKYNWGEWGYRMAYFDVNEEKKQMIVSYPQDHDLYIYSLQTKTREHYYAGSRQISTIKGYDEKKEYRPQYNKDRVHAWFLSNPSYRSVIYDKYHKLYYRLAFLPKEEKMNDFYTMQPAILIVLDKNYQYLGECELPVDVDFNPTNCFASPEGFNIQIFTDNENFYTFYQYKIEIDE